MTRKKTVLIVDDNEDARFVMSAILNYDGYHVIAASNGADGVVLARRELPDIVLMDLRMPVMDGFEAAGILKGDEATRHIPILAVSADMVPGSQRARSERLFSSCLLKPLESAVLEAQVRRLIGEA